MNILITGAGLIGSNAARHAVDAGHKVVLFDLSPNRDYIQKVVGENKADVVVADMRDLPALLAALEKYNVDTLVATAGLIGSRVQENSYTGATNNILGTINVLEAARLRKLKRDRLRQHVRRLRSHQDQRQRHPRNPPDRRA